MLPSLGAIGCLQLESGFQMVSALLDPGLKIARPPADVAAAGPTFADGIGAGWKLEAPEALQKPQESVCHSKWQTRSSGLIEEDSCEPGHAASTSCLQPCFLFLWSFQGIWQVCVGRDHSLILIPIWCASGIMTWISIPMLRDETFKPSQIKTALHVAMLCLRDIRIGKWNSSAWWVRFQHCRQHCEDANSSPHTTAIEPC